MAVPDLNLRILSPAVKIDRAIGCCRQVGSIIDQNEQDIKLGSERLKPIHLSSSPVRTVSTSNTNMFEVETLGKSLQPLYNEDHACSSSLGNSQIAKTWAHSRQTQTERYLTEGTPRKRMYRQELDEKSQEIEFLRNKVRALESKIEILECKKNVSIVGQEENRQITELCDKLPPHLAICVRNCLKNSPRNSKGFKYNRELKTLALAVKFLSPITYRYLQPIFNWPSQVTREQFVQGWPTVALAAISAVLKPWFHRRTKICFDML